MTKESEEKAKKLAKELAQKEAEEKAAKDAAEKSKKVSDEAKKAVEVLENAQASMLQSISETEDGRYVDQAHFKSARERYDAAKKKLVEAQKVYAPYKSEVTSRLAKVMEERAGHLAGGRRRRKTRRSTRRRKSRRNFRKSK